MSVGVNDKDLGVVEERLKFISDCFIKIDISLSERQVWQFYRYYELLVEKNKVMNLTAITEFEDVVLKHFVDSCLCSEQFVEGDGSGKCLIDVGTGAGFPGIPLKILFPGLKVTLLDSLNKRVLFLREVIEELGLVGVDTVHARAEDGARDPKLREKFDFVVSRAVAQLSVLAEYCIPFAKRGGLFVAFKSVNLQDELVTAKKAIFLLGGKDERLIETVLPGSDMARSLVLIRKKEGTSKKFPRKAGLPSKQPL